MTGIASDNALALGAYRLPLDRTLIMGALNVTPDSFSDGGQNFDARAAIDRSGSDDGRHLGQSTAHENRCLRAKGSDLL